MEVFQKQLGLHVDIAIYLWKRCQLMVKNGEADIMVTTPTPERKKDSVPHSRPIWIKRRILYTFREHPRIHEIHLLNGLAAIRKGGGHFLSWQGLSGKKVPGIGIPVSFATTVDSRYGMLASKRGDLIIEEKVLAAPISSIWGFPKKLWEPTASAPKAAFIF